MAPPAAWFGNSHSPTVRAEPEAGGSATWYVVYRPGRRPRTVLYVEPGPDMDGFEDRDARREAHRKRYAGPGGDDGGIRRVRVDLDGIVDPGADI